jgi:hypothetical protein
MFCLEESPGLGRVIESMLPAGFSSEAVELTVSGRCGACAGQPGPGPARPPSA